MKAEILRINPVEPEAELITRVVDSLNGGKVVAVPTDTFYGLAVDPVNLRAVDRIYEIKTRARHKPLSLLIAETAQAYELAREIDTAFDRLAEKFWPGPLTIVVKAGSKLPLRVTANTGNVALRVPEAPISRAVVARLGLPITAYFGQSKRLSRMFPGQRCLRPARRSDTSHRRWRPYRRLQRYHHRRSLRRGQFLDDSARRSHPDPRDRTRTAALLVESQDRTTPDPYRKLYYRHMNLPDPQSGSSPRRGVLRRLIGVVLLITLAWFTGVIYEINSVADHDEARPSDAIAVFGAAE